MNFSQFPFPKRNIKFISKSNNIENEFFRYAIVENMENDLSEEYIGVSKYSKLRLFLDNISENNFYIEDPFIGYYVDIEQSFYDGNKVLRYKILKRINYDNFLPHIEYIAQHSDNIDEDENFNGD